MSNKQIITSSGIEFQNSQPLDVRDRIQTLSDVETIQNPDIGGIFYCLDTGYYYTITSLTDDQSKVRDYELFTSIGAESVTVNDETIRVTDSNVITIPDDSHYLYESKELRNSQRINITKEKEGKTYSGLYAAESDLKDFLGKTLPSDLKSSIKMVCTAFGKTNQDSDRDIISDISGNGNNLLLSGFSYTSTSGYGNSNYPCALVTDGVDDFIYSENTINKIIGSSGKLTVVSMITQLSDSTGGSISTNNIRYNSSLLCCRNIVSAGTTEKSGIYGYTCPNLNVAPTVPNSVKLLGDKEDYVSQGGTHQANDIYSVVGYKNAGSGNLAELSQVAWYWTFIADRVLTENEIHLIIEYYNLDRCINPQIYYNISQQGITNDNHSDFSDKLVDLSGNGYDMQLNNISWDESSGIGKYPVNLATIFPKDASTSVMTLTKTSGKFTATNLDLENGQMAIFRTLSDNTVEDIPSFQIKISGITKTARYHYIEESRPGQRTPYPLNSDGIYTLPASKNSLYSGENAVNIGFAIDAGGSITVEVVQDPTYTGALCFDGVDDFGKATGLPTLKDYTVVADRELYNGKHTGAVVSKAYAANNGSFYFESSVSVASFGGLNRLAIRESRFMSYQSKYIYNGNPIQVGTGVDSDSMWLGTIRDDDTRFSKVAIWSFLLYPYSMSEFLIERQLKKLKLGTLYPGMIQWKPIVESNIPYKRILYFDVSTGNPILVGDYIPIGTRVQINIATTNETDEISSVTLNGEEMTKGNVDAQYWRFILAVTKSPQRIDITIDD